MTRKRDGDGKLKKSTLLEKQECVEIANRDNSN